MHIVLCQQLCMRSKHGCILVGLKPLRTPINHESENPYGPVGPLKQAIPESGTQTMIRMVLGPNTGVLAYSGGSTQV